MQSRFVFCLEDFQIHRSHFTHKKLQKVPVNFNFMFFYFFHGRLRKKNPSTLISNGIKNETNVKRMQHQSQYVAENPSPTITAAVNLSITTVWSRHKLQTSLGTHRTSISEL